MEVVEYVGFMALLSILCIVIMIYVLGEVGSLPSYTEVYFQDAFEKMSKKRIGDEIVFTIRNMEGAPVNYSYNVTAYNLSQGEDSAIEVASGMVNVGDTQSSNITFNIPKKHFLYILNSEKPVLHIIISKEGHVGTYRELRRMIID
ncbi:MAG: hypothetical protein ABIH11_06885 [Candidatus Altiarchaeota archaeon]